MPKFLYFIYNNRIKSKIKDKYAKIPNHLAMFRCSDCSLARGSGFMNTCVCCYIDGFNLYHSIIDVANRTNPPSNYLKWLDIRALAMNF
jgi:hypothetical protein